VLENDQKKHNEMGEKYSAMIVLIKIGDGAAVIFVSLFSCRCAGDQANAQNAFAVNSSEGSVGNNMKIVKAASNTAS